MFVKFKAENSDKVAKIKYEGQDFQKIKALAASKLSFIGEFDLYYVDEEGEKIVISEDSDWQLCLELQTTNLANSSATGNLTLTIRSAESPTVTASIGSTTQQVQTHSAYPQALVEQKPSPQSQAVTVSGSTPQFVSAPVPANPLMSSLFGGIQPANPTGSSSVLHNNIVCDGGCGQGPLVGIRYKSILENDFDVCQKCVEQPSFQNASFHQNPIQQ